MGKAFQCDRCYEFENDTPVMTVTFQPAPHIKTVTHKTYELCSQCLSDLGRFIQDFAVEDGQDGGPSYG